MRVASLYAELGISEDKRSFSNARRELHKLQREAEIAGSKAGGGFWQKFQKRNREGFGRGPLLGGLLAPLGLAGVGAGVFAAGRDALAFDDALTQLDISSRGAMGSLDQVSKRILDVSSSTGVAKESVLSGARAFVSLTGDGAAASRSMETFARVNRATGASMEETATVAATLSQQFGLSASEFERGFSILARGGKEGAVEFRDMASLMAELGAAFKPFGGSQGTKGLATLGGLFQMARRDTGSAAEAQTRLSRFMESLSSPRTVKMLKQVGVEVFEIGTDGQKRLRPVLKILDDMGRTRLATDPMVLNRAFESSEARAAARSLLTYRKELDGIIAATENASDISEDYAKRQESASARVAVAWGKVKNAIAEAALPIVESLPEGFTTPDRAQQLNQSRKVAEDLRGRGITPEQLKRPWELPLEVQTAIHGRDIDVANELRQLEAEGGARQRRARAEARRYGPFRNDLEAMAAGSYVPTPVAAAGAAAGRRTTNTVNVHPGAIVVNGATDPKATASAVAEQFRFLLGQERVALGS
jgi:TP901 family phage tail tape measure protein